jgi:hypothetical protein
MKILFITEKYVVSEKYGITNNMVNLIGSFKSTNLGEYKHLFISQDEGDLWTNEQLDNTLLTEDFDLAVVSPIAHMFPSLKVAERLQNKLMICWCDTLFGSFEGFIAREHHHTVNGVSFSTPSLSVYSLYCPNVVFDYGNGEEYKNIFGLSVPQDPTIYNSLELTKKDIDVSFMGAIKNERGPIIELLKNNGINVYTAGGRGEGGSNLSFEDYADVIKRSKISLNFNWAWTSPQRKGRIFEIAACGNFMLSNFPEALKGEDGYCFEDGKHFVSFNENNIIEKVKYWLDHNEEREQIAKSMNELYKQKYAPLPWWENIFKNVSKII